MTDFSSPLSGEEIELCRRAAVSRCRVFVAINKRDTASENEQAEIVAVVEQKINELCEPRPAVFVTSALEARRAQKEDDAGLLHRSGIPSLGAELIRFLTDEKRQAFFNQMLVRVNEVVRDLSPHPAEEFGRALQSIGASLDDPMRGESAQRRPEAPPHPVAQTDHVSTCLICRDIERVSHEYMVV